MLVARPGDMRLTNPSAAIASAARVFEAQGRTTDSPRRIVAIGGGTGLPAVIEGLCGSDRSDIVTAVVTMTDDGGSSGRLRETFGVAPPGDVRNCLAAAADADSPFRELLQHRFSQGSGMDGHPFGNLLLTALTQITGSFPEAVEKLGDMMGLRASVLPSTRQDVHLIAEMESGRLVFGETAITRARERIRRLSLHPDARPLPEVLCAIVNADAIVVGPGSLYSSILPNLLVAGVASTISAASAVRICVTNLLTEPGETDGYSPDDHLRAIREHVGLDLFDYILVNNQPMDPEVLALYAAQGASPVTLSEPLRWAGRAQVVECKLAGEYRKGKIRHSPSLTARAIRALTERGPQRRNGN